MTPRIVIAATAVSATLYTSGGASISTFSSNTARPTRTRCFMISRNSSDSKRPRTEPGNADRPGSYLYSTVGSQRPMAGNSPSSTSAPIWMIMNGTMPMNIWASVTCGGATPFR
jgi:hypothetical protein